MEVQGRTCHIQEGLEEHILAVGVVVIVGAECAETRLLAAEGLEERTPRCRHW